MLLGGGLNIGHMTENRGLGVRRRVEVMIIRGTEERMGGTLQSRGIETLRAIKNQVCFTGEQQAIYWS